MSTVRMTIETNNAAFSQDVGLEVARILRDAADRIEQGHGVDALTLRDINGNRVGELEVFEDNPPLRIRPKHAYRHASYPASTALDPTVTYDAVHATNQPDWKKQGKIFVESPGNAPEMLLKKGEYAIVSQNPYDPSIYGGGHYVPPSRSSRAHDPQSLPLNELEDWIDNDEGLYTWWKQSRMSKRKFVSENRDELRKIIRAALDRPPGR